MRGFILGLMIMLGGIVNAQNPSDGCPGTVLPINASCSSTSFSVPGVYTNGGLVMSTNCTQGQDRDDGWYQITPTSTGTVTIQATGSNNGMALVVYTACGGGTELACDEQTAGTDVVVSFSATSGVTYYVQVHRRQGNGTASLSGNICAYYGAPVASGGGTSCADAANLSIGTQVCATNSNAGSFPDDGTSPTNPCSSSYNDGEYWFAYTGTGDGLQLDITGLTDTYSGLFVLDDCPSNSPNCIASYTSGWSTADFTLTTPALTNGQTYYIVLANYSSPYQTDFCIDASTYIPPPPPANDECSGAYSVTVNSDQNCGSTTAGTVEYATTSSQSTAACGGTENDDVWFSFVATSVAHEIDILNVSGSTTDMYHSLWEGSCPALSLVSGTCSDGNNQIVGGLTPGNTYYIRVYTYGSSNGQNSTFDVCVGTPPPPPANDECSGAYSVTVNPDMLCGTTTSGSTTSATPSSQSSASCGGTENDDVWFSFVATNTSHPISILNVSGSTTDMYHSVWEGNCPALSLVSGSCSDANSQTVTGLTIGNTYYIRVYTYSSTTGATTDFDVCVGTPPPPPTNDECVDAIPVPTNNDGTCTNYTVGYTSGATSSMSGCTGTADDDVWFSFVAASPSHDFSISNATGTTDLVHEVFSGSCGSLVSLECSDPNTSTVGGLTVGDTYYVRVYTYSSTGDNTSFELCITTNCDASYDEPTCGLDYTHSDISYSPANYNTGTDLSFSDDRFADSYTSIGFPFCFDGVWYSECLVSSNGYITFPGCYSEAPPEPKVEPGGYSPYSMSQNAPNTGDAPRNAIMGPWQDIDPSVSGSAIRYSTVGTSPNRVFIVKFDNVGMFDCNSLKFSGQIMLYETTNDIEVHIGEKTTCSTWNDEGAILGLHNYDGSTAVIPNGYNYSTPWTVPTNNTEAHLFTNNCNCVVVLPVELGDFYGTKMIGYNLLEWETISERENDYFVLEASNDGTAFYPVGTIDAVGNSQTIQNYSFKHENPQGATYYRLRQVDNNGSVQYHKTILLGKNSNEISLFPNPTNKDLYLNISQNRQEELVVTYTDVLGKSTVESIFVVPGKEKYALSNFGGFADGIYLVRIKTKDGDIIHEEKIVKH